MSTWGYWALTALGTLGGLAVVLFAVAALEDDSLLVALAGLGMMCLGFWTAYLARNRE